MAKRNRQIKTLTPTDTTPAVKANGFTNYSQWWLSGGDISQLMGAALLFSDTPYGRIQAAQLNVWAANCIAARSETLASVDLKLYRKASTPEEEDEEVIDHPVLDLLEEVNPINLKKTSFREQIERQLSIHGECYIHKVRGKGGVPEEMYILPAQFMESLPDATRLVAGYRYQSKMTISPEDVIRIYYPSDENPLFARSPLTSAINAINNYNLSDLAQQGIDRRGGQGGGIVMVDFNAIQGDPQRFMSEWDAKRSDPRNAGRDAFLPTDSSYESGTLTAQQQQREERAIRLIREIMAAFRVPPSLAGDYKDASVLANAAQQSRNFWETFLLFELKRMEDAVNYGLLWQDYEGSKDEGLYLAHDTSEVAALSDGLDAEVNRNQVKATTVDLAYGAGIITLNEARIDIGKDRVDDPKADEIPVLSQPEVDPMTGMPADPMAAGGDMAGGDMAAPVEPDPEIESLLSEAGAIKASLVELVKEAADKAAAHAIATLDAYKASLEPADVDEAIEPETDDVEDLLVEVDEYVKAMPDGRARPASSGGGKAGGGFKTARQRKWFFANLGKFKKSGAGGGGGLGAVGSTATDSARPQPTADAMTPKEDTTPAQAVQTTPEAGQGTHSTEQPASTTTDIKQADATAKTEEAPQPNPVLDNSQKKFQEAGKSYTDSNIALEKAMNKAETATPNTPEHVAALGEYQQALQQKVASQNQFEVTSAKYQLEKAKVAKQNAEKEWSKAIDEETAAGQKMNSLTKGTPEHDAAAQAYKNAFAKSEELGHKAGAANDQLQAHFKAYDKAHLDAEKAWDMHTAQNAKLEQFKQKAIFNMKENQAAAEGKQAWKEGKEVKIGSDGKITAAHTDTGHTKQALEQAKLDEATAANKWLSASSKELKTSQEWQKAKGTPNEEAAKNAHMQAMKDTNAAQIAAKQAQANTYAASEAHAQAIVSKAKAAQVAAQPTPKPDYKLAKDKAMQEWNDADAANNKAYQETFNHKLGSPEHYAAVEAHQKAQGVMYEKMKAFDQAKEAYNQDKEATAWAGVSKDKAWAQKPNTDQAKTGITVTKPKATNEQKVEKAQTAVDKVKAASAKNQVALDKAKAEEQQAAKKMTGLTYGTPEWTAAQKEYQAAGTKTDKFTAKQNDLAAKAQKAEGAHQKALAKAASKPTVKPDGKEYKDWETDKYGAMEWAKNTYPNGSKILNSTEFEHVKDYTGSAYDSINGALRAAKTKADVPEFGWVGKHIQSMDTAIAKSTVPTNTVVWRGTKLNASAFKVGATITDKGYMSTSLDKSVAQNFSKNAVMKIKLPAGAKALHVSDFSNHQHEAEVILPRNSKFRVVNVIENPYKTIVEVEPVFD